MSKRKRTWFKLDLGPATARVFAYTFAGACHMAARDIRAAQAAKGVKPKDRYRLITDLRTRGYKDVHGGAENEGVVRLAKPKTVKQIVAEVRLLGVPQ